MMDHLLTLWVALESRLNSDDESGQTIIEYALILAFVAAVAAVLGAGGAIRDGVNGAFDAITGLF